MKTLLEFDHKKATQVINFFTRCEGGEIEKLKLIKLVYLADRLHLRRYGRPIVNDAYLAMPLGPVGSSVKDIAEFSGFLDENERAYASDFLKLSDRPNILVSKSEPDLSVLSKSEVGAIQFIYEQFGKFSASKLVDITHKYPEWSKFEASLKSRGVTRERMSYVDFFENPEGETNDKFKLDAEVLEASKELYNDSYQIAEFWR